MEDLEGKVDQLSDQNLLLRERVFLLEGQVYELTHLTKPEARGPEKWELTHLTKPEGEAEESNQAEALTQQA